MATLDHIGLNRYIYMSASIDDMTLGSFTVSDISNSSGYSILGGNLDDSRLLLGINLYNNGPYGYSSWQQMRMSENPLSRHLRKNNQFSIIGNGKERIYFSGGKRYKVLDRHGSKQLFDEPVIVSAYKPIKLVGTIDEYNNQGAFSSNKFRKYISLNNNVAYFTNDKINSIVGLVESNDEVYDILKSYYLEDGINSPDSPMSSFEKLEIFQTIYPPQQYTYKSYTRERTTFSFNWNSDINNRQQYNISDGFSYPTNMSSSLWPLDVDPNWINFSLPLVENLGYREATVQSYYISSSFGILVNHYSQISLDLNDVTGLGGHPNNRLRPAPYYSRRHTLYPSESVVAPSGRTQLIHSLDNDADTIFGGEAAWDVPAQSGKYPFYDSYSEGALEMRNKAKNYTIVPEFRMSEHVATFLSSSIFKAPSALLEITGGKESATNSAQDNFYKIYSNSDFLKNFDIVLEDHKDFTEPSKITLKCRAFKKLVPYDGFYPVQRTVDLSEQFYSSYKDFITVSTGSGYNPFGTTIKHAFQNIMTPLFAPGVLFNSIKSGIAVDYPIITGSLSVETTPTGPYTIQNASFDKRIPFEAIVEPEKHLSDYTLICNEPHPSGNLSSSAFWDGQGDQLYSRMANNFVAEIPNFFLKNEKFTTISSLPQGDPNFGQVVSDHDVYTMRVKLYRSMDSANFSVTSSDSSLDVRYVPPQDMVSSGRKETITMYSRPSAFGPPWAARPVVADFNADPPLSDSTFYLNSQKGYNFPFTPPYYHGQAWADVTFTPTELRKYTVAEILASSSVQYYRFDTLPFTTTSSAFTGQEMQLNASFNLFSKGKIGEVGTSNAFGDIQTQPTDVQVDDQSKARWIIQPKFETPILNFADYIDAEGQTDDVTLPTDAKVASQTPIGMWHQYGRIPTETEGIYIQVTDIPDNWTQGRLGISSTNGTGSLADLCGFSQNPVKLGQVNNRKKISECVVAVPFIENAGVKEFFKLNDRAVKQALGQELGEADETLVDLIDKMERFVFPPSFDFVNFPNKVDPVAMYVFEFSTYLSQQDLVDIWQNVLPDIGRTFETSESSISHSLLGQKRMINRSNLREDIRWMVFKVKQRAASRYYDQVFTKKGDITSTPFGTDIEVDSAGPRSKIQYNWPYDFFSLVELVKIDASFEFSDVETDDNGQEKPKPKVAREENRRIQLDTLFPKGKK